MKQRPKLMQVALFFAFTAPATGFASQESPEKNSGDKKPSDDTVIRARGTLESASQLDIRSQAGQPLPLIFLVPEGKVVKEGTVLAKLDPSALEEQLQQQRFVLKKTRADIAVSELNLEAAAGESEAFLEVAKMRLVVAEGALNAFQSDGGEYQLELKTTEQAIRVAERRLRFVSSRIKELEEGPDEPEVKRALEETEVALSETEAGLSTAKSQHKFLMGSYLSQKTAELKLGIAQAKLELIRAKNGRSQTLRSGEARLIASRTHHEAEVHKLARLERQLVACNVQAPRAGRVAYPPSHTKSPIQAGSILRDGQVIVRLTDTTKFKLDVTVPLSVAQKVTTGQTVKVLVDAYPDRAFEGRITRLRVVPKTKRQTRDEAMIAVRVDDESGALKAGLTTRVEFK